LLWAQLCGLGAAANVPAQISSGEQAGAIAGRVTFGGNPAAGVTVAVQRRTNGFA